MKILKVKPVRSVYLDSMILGELTDKSTKAEKSWEIINLARSKTIKLLMSGFTLEELDDAKPKIKRTTFGVMVDVPVKMLKFSGKIYDLATKYMERCKLKRTDAYHLASSAVHGTDVFLTWNRKDILVEKTLKRIKMVNDLNGYDTPIIIAPDDFLERMSISRDGNRIFVETD